MESPRDLPGLYFNGATPLSQRLAGSLENLDHPEPRLTIGDWTAFGFDSRDQLDRFVLERFRNR